MNARTGAGSRPARREREGSPRTPQEREATPRTTRPTRRPPRRASATASRRPRRGWIVGGVVVLVLVVLAGVAFGTSTFLVTDVTVDGAAPEDVAAVRSAAAVPPDENLLLLDTSEVAARVLANPRVATVDVRRSLPGTVSVTVAEREPVLAVPAGPGVSLVDATGFAYRAVATRPPGVPTLRLPPRVAPTPDGPATRAAVAVVVALPASLRRSVTDVTATGPFDVALDLTGGRQVRWGADDQNPRKAAVLAALLSRPGHVYDVSTPELAVVS